MTASEPTGCLLHGIPAGGTCCWCQPRAPVTPPLVAAGIPVGWECPRCKCVYAPRVENCWRCSPFGGPLPRAPRAFTERPFGPFSPVPVRGPAPAWCPDGFAGCGCGKPEGAPPLRTVIGLPSYMEDRNSVHISRIGLSWGKVFDGLEAQFAGSGGGTAVVHFRLAPEGDGEPGGSGA